MGELRSCQLVETEIKNTFIHSVGTSELCELTLYLSKQCLSRKSSKNLSLCDHVELVTLHVTCICIKKTLFKRLNSILTAVVLVHKIAPRLPLHQ